MATILRTLLALLASLTRQELAQQVTYLKAENRILRSKLSNRITLSNQERRILVRHDKKLGARIKGLLSIVSCSTFRRWVRTLENTPVKRPAAEDSKSDPPCTEESLSELIIRIRKEFGFGYTKNLQEVQRLGIHVSW